MLKNGDRRFFRLSMLALVAVLALVCMPSVTFADVVTLQLNGTPATPIVTGTSDYADPYPMLVNGIPELLACDDLLTTLGGPFTANRYLLADLGTSPADAPKFDNTVGQYANLYSVQIKYYAVAWLTLDLLSNQANEIIDTSAIWSIFDGAATAPGATTLAKNTLDAVQRQLLGVFLPG